MSTLVCAGCGSSPPPEDPYPFRCPDHGVGDVDHVLRRVLDPAPDGFPTGGEANPFLRYRSLLLSARRAAAAGGDDQRFVALVNDLDRRVEAAAGVGFRVTPFRRSEVISDALGFSGQGGVWVKDETGNVAGSHKGRHLFGILLHLEVARLAGAPPAGALAIASCGNAALAAATVAAAAGLPLVVMVPVDADPGVLEELGRLGARVVACERRAGGTGDPTLARLLAEVDAGAVPFTCQGHLNGLAIEGGETLGWELAEQLAPLDPPASHLVVQVGGGALASSCAQGLDEARALRALPALPRLHTVQTTGAHPLERAYHALRRDLPPHPGPDDIDRALAAARRRRSAYMRPWETEPHSVATGILDDETYDWAAVVGAMLRTGGQAAVPSEDRLVEAHALGRRAGYAVSPTGTAGLAGVLDLLAAGVIRRDERAVVLFSGHSPAERVALR